MDCKKPPASNRGVNPLQTTKNNNNPGLNWNILEPSPGVDWITALTDNDDTGMAWFQIWARTSGHTGKQAHLGRDWTRYGYSGRELGDSRWGMHPNHGYMVTAWGKDADEMWLQIAPTASKVTRLDLKVDVVLADPLEGLAKSYYQNRPKKKVPRYSLFSNSWDGTTLYIGSRNSDFFARCYDKGAQEGHEPGRRWRYEVQVNKPKSHPLARDLVDRFKLEGPGAWRDVIGYVYQHFDGRGCTPIFKRMPTKIKLEPQYRVTTRERKISWLRSQVRPTVEKLIKAGLGDEVVKALKLENYIQPGIFDSGQNVD